MRFDAKLQSLEAMMSHVRQEAKRLNIPPKAIHKMELACEEAIVNIISYAKSPEEISLECSLVDETHFEVVIKDRGPPFNPLEVAVDLQTDTPILDRKIGGLGIYLIRKLIDESTYLREGGTNILRLTLRLEVPEED